MWGNANHEAAVQFVANLPPSRLVTTNFVLDETVTRVRTRLGVKAALQIGKQIIDSGEYEVVTIADSICRQALEKMRKFSDKLLSFTDCTSFVIMEEKKIRDVFAFDNDFTKAGFLTHPQG